MNGFETLSETLNDLSLRGYTLDFCLHGEKDCLVCRKTTRQLFPDEFIVDEYYRLAGATDSKDEIIVYALSSSKYNVKGVVVNSIDIYNHGSTSKIVEKLKQFLVHDEVD